MKPVTFKLDDETHALVRRGAKKRHVTVSVYLREAAREQAIKDARMKPCRECGHLHVKTKTDDVRAA
jgi:Ribbon-helix-helix protein, copG family